MITAWTPAAIVIPLQTSVPSSEPQLPPPPPLVIVAEPPDVFAGGASVSLTLTASLGPLFVIVCTQVMVPLTCTSTGVQTFVTLRSADVTTGIVTLALAEVGVTPSGPGVGLKLPPATDVAESEGKIEAVVLEFTSSVNDTGSLNPDGIDTPSVGGLHVSVLPA